MLILLIYSDEIRISNLNFYFLNFIHLTSFVFVFCLWTNQALGSLIILGIFLISVKRASVSKHLLAPVDSKYFAHLLTLLKFEFNNLKCLIHSRTKFCFVKTILGQGNTRCGSSAGSNGAGNFVKCLRATCGVQKSIRGIRNFGWSAFLVGWTWREL